MTEKDLFEALNDLDDSILEESETNIKGENHFADKKHELLQKEAIPVELKKNKKGMIIAKWVALAASLILVVIVGIMIFRPNKNNKTYTNTHTDEMGGYTGSNGPTSCPGDTASSNQQDKDLIVDGGVDGGKEYGYGFTRYEGPVFPLYSMDPVSDIMVERDIDFGFSPYVNKTQTDIVVMNGVEQTFSYEIHESMSLVTDSYRLVNSTNEDKQLTLLYPFVGKLTDAYQKVPVVSVNGQTIKADLKIGPFSGSFTGAGEQPPVKTTFNISDVKNWEEYKKLIESGYISLTMDELPGFDQKVIVYELKDRYAEDFSGAPYLNISFKADTGKTTIMTYRFNGYSLKNSGERSYGGFIPKEYNADYGKSAYMIVLGEDIGDYTLKAYTNGGCDTELEGAGCTIVRYESILGEILGRLYKEYADEYIGYSSEKSDNSRYIYNSISDEYNLGLLAELMESYGLISDAPVNRYSDGSLEMIVRDALIMNRLMCQSFTVDIPANGEATVSMQMKKQASVILMSDNTMIDGYDMVTSLGSNLEIKSTKVSLSDIEHVEIAEQDFGFDIINGKTSVDISTGNDHYSMKVRKTKNQ
ncbi:MAG: hypothetical protein IKP88_10380 [Lachnospiraceae bacterium]|nr:hypothetical protein [Lachnospiraceae bacterium]